MGHMDNVLRITETAVRNHIDDLQSEVYDLAQEVEWARQRAVLNIDALNAAYRIIADNAVNYMRLLDKQRIDFDTELTATDRQSLHDQWNYAWRVLTGEHWLLPVEVMAFPPTGRDPWSTDDLGHTCGFKACWCGGFPEPDIPEDQPWDDIEDDFDDLPLV